MKVFKHINKKWERIAMLLLAPLFLAPMLSACDDDDEIQKESIIVADKDVSDTPFDKWLNTYVVEPYNLKIDWRWTYNDIRLGYYTVPASYESAVILAHVLKHCCLEAYDEAAGISFTRHNFPKQIVFVGTWEYNNNGTKVLGTAEGGKKIWLAGVNHIKENINLGAGQLNSQYLKTMHHEFTHILNQNSPYQVAFKELTKTTYVADSWSKDPYNVDYRKRGYITSYAQHSPGEDFAELYSVYVTSSAETWQSYMDEAVVTTVDENGIKTTDYTYQNILQKKIDMVRAYMEKSWGIDMDVMREVLARRLNDVVNGNVDLTDLTIVKD